METSDLEVERHTFAAVSALAPRGPEGFDATVHPGWTIGGRPNGGYLLAMLGRAAESVVPHPHVISASAHYLHSPEPGAVVVGTEVLRTGQRASQVRATISQEGRPCVEALITTSLLEPAAVPYWAGGLPRPSPQPYADCIRLAPHTPDGGRVSILEQVEVRLEADSAGFLEGKPKGRGELRGWLSLPGSEPFSPASLLYAVDAFPPATFDVEFSGWVPTYELTVYVRALPAPGPVYVVQRAQLIESQLVDESCFVWDARHRLVAHGSQLAGIRLG